MSPFRPRPRVALLIVALLAVTALALALLPTRTRQGVDYVVRSRELPAWEKALDFVQRDIEYARLAADITRGRRSDPDRLAAVYDWTRLNIRDVPEGFPVVDDHVWHIVVRGYGTDDQKADVFTTLATYAGLPAFWALLPPSGPDSALPVSFVRVDGRWTVVDVAAGVRFVDARGVPLPVTAIARERGIVSTVAGDRRYRGIPYAAYYERLCGVRVPPTLRAEKQMLWPRLIFEARRLLRVGRPEAGGSASVCALAADRVAVR